MRRVNRSKRQTCLLLPKRVCWKSGPKSNKRLYYLTRSHYLSDPDPESWIHTCNNIVADPLSFLLLLNSGSEIRDGKKYRKNRDKHHGSETLTCNKKNRSTPWIIGLPDLNPESKLGLQCANPILHGSQSFSGSGSSTQPPVLRIRNVYPCFRIKLFLSRIPDPNFLHPGSTSKYFNSKKLFFKLTDIWSGFFIDADPDFYPSQIQGFKRHRIPDAPHWQPHYKVQIIIITKKVYGLFACRAANADP
jgi:hypothetical protein